MPLTIIVAILAFMAIAFVAYNFPKLLRLLRVNSLFKEDRIVNNFSDMQGMFLTTEMPVKSDKPTALPENPLPMPESFTFRGTTHNLNDWQKERNQTAMIVLKNGAVAYEEYFKGSDATHRRIGWSVSKSFLSAAFGVAVRDGHILSLDSPVTEYLPDLLGTAYEGVSILNVLNMASGIKFNEDYLDFNSDINKMSRVLALGMSMDSFAQRQVEKARPSGARRQYVSIDTHVLGMILRVATGETMADYLAEAILKPLGLEADAYYITDGHGTAFVLGGLNMRTRDYARFGLMMSQGGHLNGKQIIPADWVKQSTCQSAPPPHEGDEGTDNALLGYGYQWWLPPEAKEGEFFGIGIYGQYVYVNSGENVVIAVNSADRKFRDGNGQITVTNMAMFRQIVETLAEN